MRNDRIPLIVFGEAAEKASAEGVVEDVTNGEEAIKLCREEAPALAILDMVMPRIGGTATASHLRERFADLPVLLTSGHSESTGAVASVVPNSHYLQKPYSPTALGRVIREILDAAGSEQAVSNQK